MKKTLMLGILLVSPLIHACDHSMKMPLDKVTFQVSAKSWVSTKMVLLMVNVNVSANQTDLVKTRDEILQSLNQIGKGDWHITQFDRSQDSSGLDKLLVTAQVRLPQAGLGDVYQLAKKVSKPGATYTIKGMDFKPDVPEIQEVKVALRQKLYNAVNDELANLNKAFAGQHYTVNRVYVIDGEAPQLPMAARAEQMNTMMVRAAGAPSIAVSNELVMSAVVEVASNRTEVRSVEKVSSR